MSEYKTIREVLFNYCDSSPIIFEFGCKDGQMTPQFYKYGRNTPKHYFAFEPDVRNITDIENNKNFPAKVELIKGAIGNKNGTSEFYMSRGKINGNRFTGGSSLLAPNTVAEKHNLRFVKTTVDIHSIDKFCSDRDIKTIDLVMADIQGGEKSMIQGAKKMLKHTKFLYLERNDKEELYKGQAFTDELIKMCKGFKVYKNFTWDVMLYNTKLVNIDG